MIPYVAQIWRCVEASNAGVDDPSGRRFVLVRSALDRRESCAHPQDAVVWDRAQNRKRSVPDRWKRQCMCRRWGNMSTVPAPSAMIFHASANHIWPEMYLCRMCIGRYEQTESWLAVQQLVGSWEPGVAAVVRRKKDYVWTGWIGKRQKYARSWKSSWFQNWR